ncbi:Capsular polysaccharide biosynthesis protein [Flavobacterium beibuense]|uniref:protein-tyrosine-phosphatase n=1 Tax=Flavobacterium beibuense TaxID=657326 RepID=A0A444WIB4_9FLAO|nr:CpsB/CapC family capsule biosynthesis tyrosine phosphatase [Flavobacterium beibuense]RYJ45601.1 Capsular polysaccharide biosynthesis protein [Flavobacterium beibuense]
MADLIPSDYVDIHSHLLPGIDDGAKDENDTLQLIDSLQGYGFSQFTATPHILPGVWNNTREGILKKEKSTLSFLKDNNISFPFKAAAEHLMDDTFVELFKSEQLLTLKENYVLVEMSYINPPINLYDILFELQVAGYKPVLAHPERYLFYHTKFDEYYKLKKAGCLFQLNLLSVTGYYGEGVLKTAERLLNEKLIDFTGSDTHHMRHAEAFKNKIPFKKHEPLIEALKNNAFFKI